MLTLAHEYEFEEEIKKSRFICRVAKARNAEEAMAFLGRVAEPKATHNCWAYRMGELHRFSDDGEPGGTAGRPMLGAIEKSGIDEVVAVVTRYFGGIKLGAGGLARAYGGVVAHCLQEAPRVEIFPRVRLRLSIPFAHLGAAQVLLDRFGAQRGEETYGSDGLQIEVSIDARHRQELQDHLRDASSGQISAEALLKEPDTPPSEA